jgi:signal transduction histidine kinase
MMIHDAELDPDVAASPTCAPGTHALYGVPVVLGDQQLGVAVMGSRSSREFSQEDQFLFRTLVQRLAALIAQARLSAELRQRAAELEIALNFRDRVLGVLSHDLRNPLGVILTSAEMLLRMQPDEQQRRSLERVRTQALQIERMIRDLLDYTRSKQGQSLPLSRRTVDLAELCLHAVEGLQLLHPHRTLQLSAQGDTKASIDPDRAAQVIGNLVSNAVRYGSAQNPIRISVRGEADAVVLVVHNRGEPIPPEMLPRVFEAFQRGSGEVTRRSPGLGLGLYIVQQIVAAHGGTVSVASSLDDGTAFTVRWPR